MKDAAAALYTCSTRAEEPTAARDRRASAVPLYRTFLQRTERIWYRPGQVGLSPVMLDRLTLNEAADRADDARCAGCDRPAGPGGRDRRDAKTSERSGDHAVRVPLGAIGIIYEARPNVTVDAAVLCLKAGNAVLLRGGSEAIRTNTALVRVLRRPWDVGLPADASDLWRAPIAKRCV